MKRGRKPGFKHSKDTRTKIGLKNSISHKNLKQTEITKEKIRVSVKNSITPELRKLYSDSNKGPRNPSWNNGKSYETRDTIEYKIWRLGVFSKDNYTCQKTGIKGGYLEAHHIENFSSNKELRYKVSNGITFSKEAHKEFHKIYGQKNNTLEQVLEFIGLS
ncbi:MAG: NUMOD3 domain-containing DNA-binding protein [Candidatus Pacearchaeota archaeon]|jgi:hypothetical protein